MRLEISNNAGQPLCFLTPLKLGTDDIWGFFVMGPPCRVFCTSIPEPLPSGCQEHPSPNCDNQKCLQTRPTSPGEQRDSTENHCSGRNGEPSAFSLFCSFTCHLSEGVAPGTAPATTCLCPQGDPTAQHPVHLTVALPQALGLPVCILASFHDLPAACISWYGVQW